MPWVTHLLHVRFELNRPAAEAARDCQRATVFRDYSMAFLCLRRGSTAWHQLLLPISPEAGSESELLQPNTTSRAIGTSRAFMAVQ